MSSVIPFLFLNGFLANVAKRNWRQCCSPIDKSVWWRIWYSIKSMVKIAPPKATVTVMIAATAMIIQATMNNRVTTKIDWKLSLMPKVTDARQLQHTVLHQRAQLKFQELQLEC